MMGILTPQLAQYKTNLQFSELGSVHMNLYKALNLI